MSISEIFVKEFLNSFIFSLPEILSITKPKIIRNMITGEYEPLSKRRINEDTCKVFDY